MSEYIQVSLICCLFKRQLWDYSARGRGCLFDTTVSFWVERIYYASINKKAIFLSSAFCVAGLSDLALRSFGEAKCIKNKTNLMSLCKKRLSVIALQVFRDTMQLHCYQLPRLSDAVGGGVVWRARPYTGVTDAASQLTTQLHMGSAMALISYL